MNFVRAATVGSGTVVSPGTLTPLPNGRGSDVKADAARLAGYGTEFALPLPSERRLPFVQCLSEGGVDEGPQHLLHSLFFAPELVPARSRNSVRISELSRTDVRDLKKSPESLHRISEVASRFGSWRFLRLEPPFQPLTDGRFERVRDRRRAISTSRSYHRSGRNPTSRSPRRRESAKAGSGANFGKLSW